MGASDQTPAFGVQQTRLANPDLKWQTNTEFNLGLDFGFFENRVTGSFEYFDKEISDLLSNRQLRTYLPISSIRDNIGSTSSKGVELTLQTRNLVGEFKWTTNFNLGTFRDRWKERDPDAIIPPYLREQDFVRPIYQFAIDGIQQVDDPIPESQPNIQPGQVRVKDLNGIDENGNLTGQPDGRITDADRIFYGTLDPGFTYGISNDFNYKGIDFSFFLQGMGDRLRFNDTRGFYLMRSASLREGRNALAEIQNRWTPENADSNIPADVSSGVPGAENPFFVENAGFLRLRNVTLGYTLPEGTLGKWSSKARIYVDAQNLFVITDYTGIDPEYDSIGAYPNQRSYTIGVNFNF